MPLNTEHCTNFPPAPKHNHSTQSRQAGPQREGDGRRSRKPQMRRPKDRYSRAGRGVQTSTPRARGGARQRGSDKRIRRGETIHCSVFIPTLTENVLITNHPI